MDIASAAAPTSVINVDTHAHVFRRNLPMVAGRRYTPDYDATLEDYLAHLDRAGLSHGVLVQPSFLGCDNQFLISALLAMPGRLRGVAVVEPHISTFDLSVMNRIGIVGIRLNLFGCELPDFADPTWRTLFARINALDWHVEVHARAGDLRRVLPQLHEAGCRVVVDHFGRPDPALGVADPGFTYLLTQAARGNVWVKLSAAYRNTVVLDENAVQNTQAAHRLLAEFGVERLLWGSDWPHTEHRDVTRFETCFTQLEQWVSDPNQRSVILGATPAQLFKI